MPTPAEMLLGCRLDGGWEVIERIQAPPIATGGFFSTCYIVRSESGERAFLKALDFSRAFESKDPARALQAMTEAYNFERDILEKCSERKMDRVVKAIGDGRHNVPDAPA